MRPLALVLALCLAGCSISIREGDTRESLAALGVLRFALYEYSRGDVRHVWVPTWHDGGLLGISSSRATWEELSILSFRNGVLVEREDLGDDRVRWIFRLIVDKADFGMTFNTMVGERKVAVGMPIGAVLFAWGPPNGKEWSNPRYYRPSSEIAKDDVLWWCRQKAGKANDAVLGHLVTMKDGFVSGIEVHARGRWRSKLQTTSSVDSLQ